MMLAVAKRFALALVTRHRTAALMGTFEGPHSSGAKGVVLSRI